VFHINDSNCVFLHNRFAESIDLDVQDPVAYKHTPYVVVLIKMAEQWAKSHDGSLPSTREEKKEFKVVCVIVFLLASLFY
jgi:hypothetical protein